MRKLLEEDIRTRPTATVSERRRFLESFAGKTLSETTLRRLLKRMGFSRKDGLWGRSNETNGQRVAWKVMVAGTIDARRLVFVDEMGTNISFSSLYGWVKKGQRAHCSVPRNRGANTTLLSSMSVEGMGPSLAVEGATNREVLETYVERVLAPPLRKAQVIVMVNLSAHKESALGSSLREPRLRAFVSAVLLTRFQSYRGGFQQDKGPDVQSRGP
jgi:hypothetical protein